MFLRVDKLQAELPALKRKDPNAAAALQELLGGKYGEMSTLGNYMFQSFNFRSKAKLDTSRNPAASSAEVGLRLLLLRREGSEVRSPGEGATSAAWSLACRAVR